jgi:phage-related protein
VRRWLRDEIPARARKIIGADLMTVQVCFPIGKPMVKRLERGLWELRSSYDDVEYRVIFVVEASALLLLHGFVKYSQKIRRADLELARARAAAAAGNGEKTT